MVDLSIALWRGLRIIQAWRVCRFENALDLFHGRSCCLTRGNCGLTRRPQSFEAYRPRLQGRRRSEAAHQPREVYFEVIPVGTSVKVTAVDSVTGLEVSIVGPVSTPRKMLEQSALRKLQYVLAKS